MTNKISLILLLIFCCSCSNEKYDTGNRTYTETNGTTVSLIKQNDASYIIRATHNNTNSDWQLKYPVFRFEYGNITGDSINEIAIGVIKTTRFDSILRKRLFLFKLYEGKYIRPLWLGSKVSFPLIDFRFTESGTSNEKSSGTSYKIIRTLEQEAENKFAVAEYKYSTFGLQWLRYLGRESDEKTARKIFKKV